MIPTCSKCQTTSKIILVAAIDIQWKSEKMLFFADGSKIIHDVILFSDFYGRKLIMTYLQDNFELNWLNISRDWWWEVNITPSLGIGLKKSKSLSFVCKEKFLTSVVVKSNHESMIKSNDGIFFQHGSEN